jgi:hypothetical protein
MTLPKETVDKIKEEARQYSTNIGLHIAYTKGATEWAGECHERDKKIELLMKSRQNQNEFINAARTLLEKFISRHEAGLLPDMFIYNEIKKFLDGTK